MNHVRRVMAVVSAIIFLIALVIGTGVILSVRNVNVTFLDYSGLYAEEYSQTRTNFDGLKGSGMVFIKDEDINSKVSHKDVFVVESYKKIYPCTVNVVLRERVETFALKTTAGYKIYDEEGKLMRTVNADKYTNAVDGCPDVEIIADEDSVKELAALSGYFAQAFGPVRRLVSSLEVRKYFEFNIASFNLRSGLSVSIIEWRKNGEAKVEKAYEIYSSLTESQQKGGSITVMDGRDSSLPVGDYAA